MESNGMSANSLFLKQIFLEVSHLNRWCEIHVTNIIKQFSLFVANSSDIPIQYLYSSSSFSINTQNHSCSGHNINHSVCGVPSVLWALLSVQQGQRYCRQTIGHYSNSSNRHTALYIYNARSVLWPLLSVQQGQRYCRLLVTIAIAAIDIQHYTSTVYHLYCGPYCQYNRARSTADRLLVTIPIAAIDIQHCTSTALHKHYSCVVQVLWAIPTDRCRVYKIVFKIIYSYCIEDKCFNIFMLYWS